MLSGVLLLLRGLRVQFEPGGGQRVGDEGRTLGQAVNPVVSDVALRPRILGGVRVR